MPTIAATLVESITGSVATVDGCHMVLQLRTTDGADIALGVPREQIMALIDHCAVSDVQCESILRSGVPSKLAVSWWNSARDQDSGDFILTLTFGKGGSLSMALTPHMATALLATLRGHFEAGASGAVPEAVQETAPPIRRSPERSSERGFG